MKFKEVFYLNKIMTGNNVDVLKTLDSNVVDLVVTSPPYDNLRNYNGFNLNIPELVTELFRVVKPGGVVVWVVGDATVKGSETGTSFEHALAFRDGGFRIHDTMIYEKNTSSFPARKDGIRYTQIFEYMFVFSKGKPKAVSLICDKKNKCSGQSNWGSNTQRGKDGVLTKTAKIKEVPEFSPRNNIWRYVVGGGFGQSDKLAYQHPATFPEKLAEDHILSWSNPGDLVLDPFGGSGTTAKMALKNGRRFIHIDISEEYNEIARKRIEGVGA